MLRVILTAMTMTHTGDGLPVKSPTEVGMSGTRLGAIERVIERGIKAGGYPGASVVVGRKGAAVFERLWKAFVELHQHGGRCAAHD